MKKNPKSREPQTLDAAAQIHIVLLKAAGLVAFDNHDLNFVLTILLSFFVHCSHLLITTMYVWSVGADLIDRDRTYNVEIVAECVGLCGVHSRFLIMFANRDRIAGILTECRKLWSQLNDNEKGTIRNFVERSARITQFYLVANGAMCVFYLTVSQISIAAPEHNETFVRTLPYVFYVDVKESPWYEITVAAQMLSMIVLSISCPGVDTAAPFLIMVACGHFKTLCERLQNLEKLEAESLLKNGGKEIIECIVYHQKIIDLCRKIEKLTNLLFMVQLLSTTYNMSLIGLKLVGDDPDKFKYLTVLTLLMIQLFMCQWAPDVLVSESESLARTAYFIPTSSHDDKTIAKLIQMLMMRSQRSIQLTAGGYVNLSMECFGSMITSAMSFFTVLRSMN